MAALRTWPRNVERAQEGGDDLEVVDSYEADFANVVNDLDKHDRCICDRFAMECDRRDILCHSSSANSRELCRLLHRVLRMSVLSGGLSECGTSSADAQDGCL